MYLNDLPSYRDFNRRNVPVYRPASLLDRNAISKESSKTFKNIMYTFWRRYCANTTMHGVRYIAQRELHWTERVGWFCLVGLAIFAYIYVSLQLASRFSNTLLTTVIESITYPVSEISFPAITICNANRINWLKIERAQQKFLPNASNETLATFRDLVKSFEAIDRGIFHDFNITSDRVTTELERISLVELFDFMIPDCEDMFVKNTKCWWRNSYYDCCELFAKHKSEYGICYGFNSILNDAGKLLEASLDYYPRRSSDFGEWTGLRFAVNISTEFRVPNSNTTTGYYIVMHDPEVWPNNAFFINSGTSTNCLVKPLFSYTTDGVRGLSPRERQCIYEHETSDFGGHTLPGLKYIKLNCVSECRQRFMVEHCGCTVEFMYPIGNYTPCNISGIICLNKLKQTFRFDKPPKNNPFFDDREDGILCSCLPACNRVRFEFEINQMHFGDLPEDQIHIDVHFLYDNMIKYRTDVAFSFLDLLVSFGGIAGLFLGCSLLSMAEIIYYLTFGLIMFLTKSNKIGNSVSQVDVNGEFLSTPKKNRGKKRGSILRFNNQNGNRSKKY